MNLMKLLTVGQSLKEGKTVLGKYKLMQPSLLPKFVCTIRPTKAAPVPSVLRAEPQTPPEILAVRSEMKKENSVCVLPPVPESRPMAAEKTQKIPVGTVLKRVEADKVAPSRINFLSRVKNKISSLGKKWFCARSRKKAGIFAVQTEWALEKITVARNDLSDADLEIVARKAPSPKPQVKPTFAEVSRGKNHGQRWIKMTARLFKRTSPFKKPAEEVPAGVADHSELAGRI